VVHFQAFIDTERWRFETRDNNLFYFAFHEIATYRSFLDIIQSRSDAIGKDYLDCMEAYSKTVEGSSGGYLTLAQQATLDRWRELSLALRLEIETYYLFATILLDRVAAAIGFYFEGTSSKTWARHSSLAKNLEAYATARNISVPQRLLDLAVSLKDAVSGFRHEQVVHQGSLRAMRATGFQTGQGPRLLLSNLYPTPGDQQHESLYLAEAAVMIDEYLTTVIELLANNRDRTPLQLVARVASST
jgi:hypothetical protein